MKISEIEKLLSEIHEDKWDPLYPESLIQDKRFIANAPTIIRQLLDVARAAKLFLYHMDSTLDGDHIHLMEQALKALEDLK